MPCAHLLTVGSLQRHKNIMFRLPQRVHDSRSCQINVYEHALSYLPDGPCILLAACACQAIGGAMSRGGATAPLADSACRLPSYTASRVRVQSQAASLRDMSCCLLDVEPEKWLWREEAKTAVCPQLLSDSREVAVRRQGDSRVNPDSGSRGFQMSSRRVMGCSTQVDRSRRLHSDIAGRRHPW